MERDVGEVSPGKLDLIALDRFGDAVCLVVEDECEQVVASLAPPNNALVDAMGLTWLLLMLLVMVVLELLSSRGSLACPAAGGSRGGRRRHFLPLLDSM